jgi:hypothetical protein
MLAAMVAAVSVTLHAQVPNAVCILPALSPLMHARAQGREGNGPVTLVVPGGGISAENVAALVAETQVAVQSRPTIFLSHI